MMKKMSEWKHRFKISCLAAAVVCSCAQIPAFNCYAAFDMECVEEMSARDRAFELVELPCIGDGAGAEKPQAATPSEAVRKDKEPAATPSEAVREDKRAAATPSEAGRQDEEFCYWAEDLEVEQGTETFNLYENIAGNRRGYFVGEDRVEYSDLVDTSVPGDYEVAYIIADSNGNVADSFSRTITVTENRQEEATAAPSQAAPQDVPETATPSQALPQKAPEPSLPFSVTQSVKVDICKEESGCVIKSDALVISNDSDVLVDVLVTVSETDPDKQALRLTGRTDALQANDIYLELVPEDEGLKRVSLEEIGKPVKLMSGLPGMDCVAYKLDGKCSAEIAEGAKAGFELNFQVVPHQAEE